MKKAIILVLILFCISGAYAADIFIDRVVPPELAEKANEGNPSDALAAISSMKQVKMDLAKNNFSTVYVEDIIVESEFMYGILKAVEIAGDPTKTSAVRAEAEEKLEFIDLDEVSYGKILNNSLDVQARWNQVFVLYDSIAIGELGLKSFEDAGLNVEEGWEILEEIKQDFYADRYGEAEEGIVELNDYLEEKQREDSVVGVLRKGLGFFFVDHWFASIMGLTCLILLGILIQRNLRIYFIKKRIVRLKYQERGLNSLIKKTQIARFRENKISGLVYNIKMDGYNKKINDIKQEVPVLEEEVKNFK